MSENNDTKPDDVTEKIEIFSTDDEKIKSIGELLSNDSSREILQLLFKKELTANQIAQETDVSLQLVKYHLNKMQDMGIVKISKIEKNIKGQDMKFYKSTKFAVVIVPSAVSERAKESKLLVRSFKTIYRFAGIGIAGVAAWFTTLTLQAPQTRTIAPAPEQETSTTEDAFIGAIPESSEAPEPSIEQEAGTAEDVPIKATPESSEAATEPLEQEAGTAEDAFLGDISESSEAPEPPLEEEASPAEDATMEAIPESEAPPEIREGGLAMDESVELAEKAEEATETASTSSGVPVLGGEEFFWPIIVTLAVIGAGLILELVIRMRRNLKKHQTQTA